jgi:hypothetical protein
MGTKKGMLIENLSAEDLNIAKETSILGLRWRLFYSKIKIEIHL